jgi:hypothetical protein
MCLGKLGLLPHEPTQPKIPQLNIIVGIYEYIGWFDIPMQYLSSLPIMTLHQRRHHLREYLPNHLLTNKLPTLLTLLEQGPQIPTRTVLHDDVHCGLSAVDDAVVVADYVGVVELAQDVDFGDELLLLAGGHQAVVHLFPDEDAAVAATLYHLYEAE